MKNQGGVMNCYMFSRNDLITIMVVLLLLCLPAGSMAQVKSLEVTQTNQQLYKKPDFASTSLGSVPKGETVRLLKEEGDWYRIDYNGKTGWMHQKAFVKDWSFKPDLKKVLFGPEVKQSQSDEAALAGKGFTPEVEKGFRRKNPGLSYAQVDRIESFAVDKKSLEAFAKEGGLKP